MTATETYDHVGHPLHGRPTSRRLDAFAAGLIEVFCTHGVGHPIPESVAWMDEHGPVGAKSTWGIHGCDGCCQETNT